MGPGKHPSDVTAKRNIQPMFLLLLIAPKQKNFASRKIWSLCGGWRKPAPALLVVGHIASCLRPAGVLCGPRRAPCSWSYKRNIRPGRLQGGCFCVKRGSLVQAVAADQVPGVQ